MQTIDLKGKKWTIDLDWEILPGDSSVKQESRDVASKTNCNYGVLVEHDGQFAIGLAKKNSKFPSASLYLALANQEVRNETEFNDYPDWIVVEEMGDDKYWMAVINRGLPSPQYDKVFDITTVKDKISELLINDTFRLYSPCGEIKSIFEGLKYVEDKTLNQLTESVQTKIKFSKLRGLPNSLIYTGIGFMVVVGVGIGASTFLDSYNLKKQAEEAIHRQQMQEEADKAAYAAKLKQYNEEVAKERNKIAHEVLNGLSGTPNILLNSWYQVIGGLDQGTHGWKMDKVECDFDEKSKQSNCVISFRRDELSTNRMLLEDYPDAVISGDQATVTRKVIFEDSSFANGDPEVLENLPVAKKLGFDTLSQLQLLKLVGIEFDVRDSAEITFVPPPKPTAPNAPPAPSVPGQGNAIAPMSIGIAKGELIVKSNDFALLKDLPENVNFNAIGAKKIIVRMSDEGIINWEAVLNYYVKSEGGQVAASTSQLNKDPNKKEDVGQPIWKTMGNSQNSQQ